MIEEEKYNDQIEYKENQNMESEYIDFSNTSKNLNNKIENKIDITIDKKTKNKIEHEALGKAGAIINIIGSFFLTILFLFSIFLIPLIIFSIWTIFSNVNYLNGKENKVAAGVLGLIFGFILGGIFVLVSK
ncbi:MAG: hypothetical protein HPAVJP_4440 [Candidatus Hepatoplasma vulgare]|nr:MAG: hypothetical protein HPAVJP_4440 [Candidatus Hepatoplasma sp.]